jgi:hypothetical protein
VPSDRENLLAQAVFDGVADACGQRCGRLRRGFGESTEVLASALEHRVERRAVGPLLDSLLCALDRAVVHGPQG